MYGNGTTSKGIASSWAGMFNLQYWEKSASLISAKHGKNSQTHFCLFWHKWIMPILAFSKVAKFCYTFSHEQWQFLHADVCHIWQKCLLFLYFYISAYIVGFGILIILAKFGKNSQPNLASFGIIPLHILA